MKKKINNLGSDLIEDSIRPGARPRLVRHASHVLGRLLSFLTVGGKKKNPPKKIMIEQTLELNNNIDNEFNSFSSLDSNGISRHRRFNLFCTSCGYVASINMKCSDRTCPECRSKIYFKLNKAWVKLVENMTNPKLLTLTMKNKPDLKREYTRTLRSHFARLLHRKYYKERITGGLYVLELKNIGQGWNIHLHAIIDTKPGFNGYMIQSQISKDWLSITKESMIVDIRKAYKPKSGLRYILKYLTKKPQINGQNELYNEVLKKTRLIQTFGSFYRTKPDKPPKLKCPGCKESTWFPECSVRKAERRFFKESGDILDTTSLNIV